jgi:hypothetical protein
VPLGPWVMMGSQLPAALRLAHAASVKDWLLSGMLVSSRSSVTWTLSKPQISWPPGSDADDWPWK